MEEKTKVFVDSNVFISLANEADSQHKRALTNLTATENQDSEIVINNLVFAEIVTIISMRLGKAEAIKWGQTILENPKVEIINIDPELQSATWQIFQKIGKKNTSFTDCSIITTMQREDTKQLLTFDYTDFKPLQKEFKFKII